MSKKLVYLMSFVLLLAVTGTASADQISITIDNPGFEDLVLTDGSYNYEYPGWGYFANEGEHGTWNLGTEFGGSAPEGENVGWANPAYGSVGVPGGFAQVLTTTLTAGTTYTLTVEVGNTPGYTWGGYAVQLLAGGTPGDTGEITVGTLLAEDNNNLTIAEDTFETSTVTYTYDLELHSGLLGEPLQIRLLNLGNVVSGDEYAEVDFDNVRLSYDYFPAIAKNPNPANGATVVCPKVVLSWTPGESTVAVNGHIVYLSESYDDVNDGVGGITHSADSYDAGRLKFGTTYYWRVDEVAAPPDSTVYPGEVWSFTTELFVYPIENVIATASSSNVGEGAENTVNGSGVDANDLHSTETTDMWRSSPDGDGPAWIEYEFDKVSKLHEMWVWNHNSSLEQIYGFGFKDVSVEYSADGIDYKGLGTTHEFAQAPGTRGYAHETTIDFVGAAAKYVRLTANSTWGSPLGGLSEVRFFRIPVHATEPYPDSGATDVDLDVVLGWKAGREAVTHNVYISTDTDALTLAGPVTEPAFDTASLDLDLGQTYHWRVDEVNDAEIPTTWQGDIWSFSTPEYIVVDDFEDYNDYEPVEIWRTWVDGYVEPPAVRTNGATSGYPDPDFAAGEHYMETTIVHSGEQAMPFFYSNTGGATYSESERTFAVPEDWTKTGIQTLVLHLRADSLSEALDTTFSLTTDGSADWFSQTAISYNDGDAAQSGDISHNEESLMQTTVSGPGTASFYWKVSSEADYDFLEFYIDGEMQDQISGEVDWQQMTYAITGSGSHTLEWRYTKDGAASGGEDTGWVDKLEWDGGGQPAQMPGNTGQLYVKVNGEKLDYSGNVADIEWMQWKIDLADLASLGVDLQKVRTLAIGITGDNASGTLYFDNFLLEPAVSESITITVPNGDFEQIYKPGSDTITADLGGGWTQGLGPDTPMDDGTATYSDGTTGDAIDIPGWIGADPQGWIDNGGSYDRDTSFPNRQGSVARQSDTPDGLYYYLSNGGGWGNAAGGLIVSDAPLATVEDGLTYTLSMLANGGATPVVLELLVDGVALTPSSSEDPELSGDWQEFSRTYDAANLAGHIGKSLTIRLGVGRGASGGQSHFDEVSLSYAP